MTDDATDFSVDTFGGEALKPGMVVCIHERTRMVLTAKHKETARTGQFDSDVVQHEHECYQPGDIGPPPGMPFTVRGILWPFVVFKDDLGHVGHFHAGYATYMLVADEYRNAIKQLVEEESSGCEHAQQLDATRQQLAQREQQFVQLQQIVQIAAQRTNKLTELTDLLTEQLVETRRENEQLVSHHQWRDEEEQRRKARERHGRSGRRKR